jgi:ABC-2 type transport system permease protein
VTVFPVLSAFLRRDWETDLSYRTAFGLQLVVVLLNLALFYYLGRVIDESDFSTSQGLSGGYFGYVAIGLALLEIVNVSLGSFSRKLREEQTTGTFEALMATPTRTSLIVVSSAAYDLIRATVSGLVVIVAAVIFFGLHIETDPGALLATTAAFIGCVGLFAALGVLIAAFTVVFKRAAGLIGIVVLGLSLLGGVYFPIEVLPPVIQTIAEALPFTWALDVVRAGLLGGEIDFGQLAGLLGFVAFLFPVSLVVFRLSVWRARRTGTLAQY